MHFIYTVIMQLVSFSILCYAFLISILFLILLSSWFYYLISCITCFMSILCFGSLMTINLCEHTSVPHGYTSLSPLPEESVTRIKCIFTTFINTISTSTAQHRFQAES